MRNYKTNLSRRHFEIVAQSVKNTAMPADVRERLAGELASQLASTNPLFNRERFIAACTPEQKVTLVAPDGRKAVVTCKEDEPFRHNGKMVRVFTAH